MSHNDQSFLITIAIVTAVSSPLWGAILIELTFNKIDELIKKVRR